MCNSTTAMCATVIIQGLALKEISCVQQCNSHVCNHVIIQGLALKEIIWCVQQCNSHVYNCDHTRPSFEGNMVCMCNSATAMAHACASVIIQARPSLEGSNMVCMCNSATAMCATTCQQGLALKEIIWCACATVQQPCVQLHVNKA